MSVNLTTKYLGINLKNPLVASASPLSRSVDSVRKLEDNGISGIVMYSLFEEQIDREKKSLDHFLTSHSESYAEALSYFPEPDAFTNLDAEEYLEQIQRLKKATEIPVIGSLNGVSPGGWMNYAKKIQDAGADALELNIYYIPTDPSITSSVIEEMYLEDLKTVKKSVSIPVAMKLSPFFSSFANMAVQLDEAGADGLVLFNRFYEPDFDLENLEVIPSLTLSTSFETRLSIHWLAILFGRVKASLAGGRGVHGHEDVLKMIMAGADITMMASVLLQRGPGVVLEILKNLENWLIEHEYKSIEQMKGSMSYKNVAEPAAFERANYMKTLQSLHDLPEGIH